MLQSTQQLIRRTFCCGPVEVDFATPAGRWMDRLCGEFTLHSVRWPRRPLKLGIMLHADQPCCEQPARGDYLVCNRFRVDRTDDGFYASSECGAWCRLLTESNHLSIHAPHPASDEMMMDELEQFLILALVQNWHRLGYVAIHAGTVTGVADGAPCAMLCAPSAGGKTTFVAGMLRRGWRTLGDDKALLQLVDGEPSLSALAGEFNLHPKIRRWFDEVGAIESLPPYSRWTPKRKVSIQSIYPEAIRTHAQPTHLFLITRDPAVTGVRLEPLAPAAVTETLLRQVVIPRDPDVARHILATIVPTARRLAGFDVRIGEDAYRDPDCLSQVEAVLS